jgi:hypothetical protein
MPIDFERSKKCVVELKNGDNILTEWRFSTDDAGLEF